MQLQILLPPKYPLRKCLKKCHFLILWPKIIPRTCWSSLRSMLNHCCPIMPRFKSPNHSKRNCKCNLREMFQKKTTALLWNLNPKSVKSPFWFSVFQPITLLKTNSLRSYPRTSTDLLREAVLNEPTQWYFVHRARSR